jgi:hypothetical protein
LPDQRDHTRDVVEVFEVLAELLGAAVLALVMLRVFALRQEQRRDAADDKRQAQPAQYEQRLWAEGTHHEDC